MNILSSEISSLSLSKNSDNLLLILVFSQRNEYFQRKRSLFELPDRQK